MATKLRTEFDLCHNRLIKHANAASNRVMPSDPATFQSHLPFLEQDITIMQLMIQEYQEIIQKIEKWTSTSTDVDKNAAFEVLATGSDSFKGYIECLQQAKDVLVVAKSNKAALQVVIGTNTVPTQNVLPHNYLMMPKIQYERFDGSDITKFELFWTRLLPIHNNPSIAAQDKLNILLGYLDGEAKKLLSSLTISATNYPVAVKTLKDKYGDKKEVIKNLYNQLDNVHCVNDTVADARLCFNQAELILNQLSALGEDINQSSIQVKWEKRIIPDWLYESCLMKISKNESFTVFRKQADDCLKIKEAVNARKDDQSSTFCNFAKDNGGDKSRKFKKKHDRGNGDKRFDDKRYEKKDIKNESSTSADKQKKKDPVCKFDGEKHYTSDCPKYRTAAERIKVCKEKRLCRRCLNSGHSTFDCRYPCSCYHCRGTNHHTAVCFKKFGPSTNPRNTKANIVASEREEDTVTPPAIINTTTTMAKKDIDSTVLPIIEIPVGSPKNEIVHVTPVLMDCGSMASYITYSFAEQLKLPVIRVETLNIETFNCIEPITKDSIVYLLKVQTKNGEIHNLYVNGIDNITKKMTMAKLDKYKHIKYENICNCK